jgi:hypothetical protein
MRTTRKLRELDRLTPGVPLYPTESDRTLSDLTPEELRSSQSMIGDGLPSTNLTLGRVATGESDPSPTGFNSRGTPFLTELNPTRFQLHIVYNLGESS